MDQEAPLGERPDGAAERRLPPAAQGEALNRLFGAALVLTTALGVAGGTFIAEEWPEDRRKMGAGYMHTGYYFGFFLAAIANYTIGANFGWRWMFMITAGISAK